MITTNRIRDMFVMAASSGAYFLYASGTSNETVIATGSHASMVRLRRMIIAASCKAIRAEGSDVEAARKRAERSMPGPGEERLVSAVSG